MEPTFFTSPEKFRAWLEKNHDAANELLIGFHKKDAGKKSITYAEALDEALCFGWIDGVRKRLDETSYTIRFTPRKPKSIWSNVNVRHVERLKKEGRMAEPGLKTYAQRDPARTGIYAFENRPKEFSPAYEKKFRAKKAAWDYFQTIPPSLRNTYIFWVMGAKKKETQLHRLDLLIESSAKGERYGAFERKPEKS